MHLGIGTGICIWGGASTGQKRRKVSAKRGSRPCASSRASERQYEPKEHQEKTQSWKKDFGSGEQKRFAGEKPMFFQKKTKGEKRTLISYETHACGQECHGDRKASKENV